MTSATAPDPVDAPDPGLRDAARERLGDLPHGRVSLGPLADFVVWAAGVRGICPPPPFESVHVLAIASDTAVASGTSSTRISELAEGAAPLALLASAAGAQLTLVDAGLAGPVPAGVIGRRVRAGSGSIDREDALSADEVKAAIELGHRLVDDAVDAGADLLVPAAVGVDAALPAVVTTAVLSGREPIWALGFDATVPDAEWNRQCRVVRDALRRAREVGRDPHAILATVGSIDLAVLTGLLLQAAARRTPVLLDGVVAASAALLAIELSPAAQGWWATPQHAAVSTERVAWDLLAVKPLVGTELRLGEGCGALAALPLLQSTLRVFGSLTAAVQVSTAPVSTAPVSAAPASAAPASAGPVSAGPVSAGPVSAAAVSAAGAGTREPIQDPPPFEEPATIPDAQALPEPAAEADADRSPAGDA